MATKQTSAAGKANTVFAVFRKCLNWEAGDVLFEDQPLLWFETLSAAQAVYYASAEQARECVLNEFKIIRRNESLQFTSGYSWATILFRFPRKRGDDLVAAEARVLEELKQETDANLGERLRVAVVASDGGHLEPIGDSKAPHVRPIDLSDELDQFADFVG